MPAPIDDKIKDLEDKLKAPRSLKAQRENRLKAIESKIHRAEDTRKKILAGAAVLKAVEGREGDTTTKWLMQVLDTALTRADERALFKLPPKQAAS